MLPPKSHDTQLVWLANGNRNDIDFDLYLCARVNFNEKLYLSRLESNVHE